MGSSAAPSTPATAAAAATAAPAGNPLLHRLRSPLSSPTASPEQIRANVERLRAQRQQIEAILIESQRKDDVIAGLQLELSRLKRVADSTEQQKGRWAVLEGKMAEQLEVLARTRVELNEARREATGATTRATALADENGAQKRLLEKLSVDTAKSVAEGHSEHRRLLVECTEATTQLAECRRKLDIEAARSKASEAALCEEQAAHRMMQEQWLGVTGELAELRRQLDATAARSLSGERALTDEQHAHQVKAVVVCWLVRVGRRRQR